MPFALGLVATARDFALFTARFAFALLADFAVFAVLRDGRALLVGLRLVALLLAFDTLLAFATRALPARAGVCSIETPCLNHPH